MSLRARPGSVVDSIERGPVVQQRDPVRKEFAAVQPAKVTALARAARGEGSAEAFAYPLGKFSNGNVDRNPTPLF